MTEKTRTTRRVNVGHGDLAQKTGTTWKLVKKANSPPELFRYGGNVVRIETDDFGSPRIEQVTKARLTNHLSKKLYFFEKRSRDGELSETEVHPPGDLVTNLLADPDPPLPVLSRVITAPAFDRKGDLHYEPGYKESTGEYLCLRDDLKGLKVIDEPTEEDVSEAVRLLTDEVMGDFPFDDDASRAHAVALCIDPFIRPMISGSTPLYFITKPVAGTGGSLLVDALWSIFAGEEAPATTEPRDRDEMRKTLLSLLNEGAAIVFLDNIHSLKSFSAGPLASAITQGQFRDRILGTSKTAKVKPKCLWVAVGNNPALSRDMARRCAPIRLDARMDRPEERIGFRHDDLLKFVSENRKVLVRAVITIVRSWVRDGMKPGQATPLGSFVSWSRRMSGILENAGIKGFLQNREAHYDRTDSEEEGLPEFASNWWSKYGEEAVFASGLAEISTCLDIGEPDSKGYNRALGNFLSSHVGSSVDGKRIVKKHKLGGKQLWALEPVEDASGLASSGDVKELSELALSVA